MRTLCENIDRVRADIAAEDAASENPLSRTVRARLDRRLGEVLQIAREPGPSCDAFLRARTVLSRAAFEHETLIDAIGDEIGAATSHTVTALLSMIVAEAERSSRWFR